MRKIAITICLIIICTACSVFYLTIGLLTLRISRGWQASKELFQEASLIFNNEKL